MLPETVDRSGSAGKDDAGLKWMQPAFAPLFILPSILTIVGYACTIRDFFLSDDFTILQRAANAPTMLDACTSGRSTWDERYFRPLSLFTWWLDYLSGGLDAFEFHLVNLAFHALNAGLLAWLVRVLARDLGAGIVAGAAYAVLPNHAEAVTWVAGRFDVLCAAGVLVFLLAWVRYQCPEGRGWHLVLSVGGLLFALASKEMAVTATLLAAAVTVCFFRQRLGKAYLGIALFGFLTAGYLLLRVEFLGGVGGPPMVQKEPLGNLFSFRSLHFYGAALLKSIAPVHRELVPRLWLLLIALPLLTLVGGFVACTRSGRLRNLSQVGGGFLLLFLITLLPVAGSRKLFDDNQGSRFLYLPTAFSCAMVGTVLLYAGRWSRRALVLSTFLSTIVIGTWLTSLVLENLNWHEAAKLSRRILEEYPDSRRANVKVVFVTGLPNNCNGAYVYNNGFASAVRLFRPDEARVVVLPGKQWEDLSGPEGARVRWAGAAGWTSEPISYDRPDADGPRRK
jgi:hypothetical protein